MRIRDNRRNALSGETVDRACWWWLRSPGNNSNNAADVNSDGSVNNNGNNVNNSNNSVRPAVWVRLFRELPDTVLSKTVRARKGKVIVFPPGKRIRVNKCCRSAIRKNAVRPECGARREAIRIPGSRLGVII